MKLIPNAAEYRLVLRDGAAWTEFSLDYNGRLYINGWEGDTPTEWEIAHCTSHGIDDIKQIHDMTGAVIAALEENR